MGADLQIQGRSWRVGTRSAASGHFEGVTQSGVTFAGEQTAEYAERGTMNGAVASGLRGAREVLR